MVTATQKDLFEKDPKGSGLRLALLGIFRANKGVLFRTSQLQEMVKVQTGEWYSDSSVTRRIRELRQLGWPVRSERATGMVYNSDTGRARRSREWTYGLRP